jgi:hypothetical protein
MTPRWRRFFQWLIFLEAFTLLGAIIFYATDGLGIATSTHDLRFYAAMATAFQLYVVPLAALANGTPWPFKE